MYPLNRTALLRKDFKAGVRARLRLRLEIGAGWGVVLESGVRVRSTLGGSFRTGASVSLRDSLRSGISVGIGVQRRRFSYRIRLRSALGLEQEFG